MTDETHFNRPVRRKAEFIKPPNLLRAKMGTGGLSDTILDKAQALLENNTVDFRPLGEMYLDSLMRGLYRAQEADPARSDPEELISGMLYPAMQLKANGGMFHYPLVTAIADRLIHYLEVIEEPDPDALEIVLAFHTSIRAVLMGKVTGDGGRYGTELMDVLSDACMRYFDKHPENKAKEGKLDDRMKR